MPTLMIYFKENHFSVVIVQNGNIAPISLCFINSENIVCTFYCTLNTIIQSIL